MLSGLLESGQDTPQGHCKGTASSLCWKGCWKPYHMRMVLQAMPPRPLLATYSQSRLRLIELFAVVGENGIGAACSWFLIIRL